MTEAKPIGEIVIETHGPERALALTEPVCGLFRAVFSLPPFNAGEAAVADQQSYFPKLTARPGFRLTVARCGDEFVGFGYGFLLAADSKWWAGLEEPLPAEFIAESGRRTFAVIDYGVLLGWRGRGVGRAVHDELLGGSGAERATLAVRPAAVQTQAIYRRWGWRRVGREVMDPPVHAPSFDILVLEELPQRGEGCSGVGGGQPVRR